MTEDPQVTGMKFVKTYKRCGIYLRFKTYLIMDGWDFVQREFPSVEECEQYIEWMTMCERSTIK